MGRRWCYWYATRHGLAGHASEKGDNICTPPACACVRGAPGLRGSLRRRLPLQQRLLCRTRRRQRPALARGRPRRRIGRGLPGRPERGSARSSGARRCQGRRGCCGRCNLCCRGGLRDRGLQPRQARERGHARRQLLRDPRSARALRHERRGAGRPAAATTRTAARAAQAGLRARRQRRSQPPQRRQPRALCSQPGPLQALSCRLVAGRGAGTLRRAAVGRALDAAGGRVRVRAGRRGAQREQARAQQRARLRRAGRPCVRAGLAVRRAAAARLALCSAPSLARRRGGGRREQRRCPALQRNRAVRRERRRRLTRRQAWSFAARAACRLRRGQALHGARQQQRRQRGPDPAQAPQAGPPGAVLRGGRGMCG